MTHYTVDYGGLDETHKRRKALVDTRAYMGRERFERMRAMMRVTEVKPKPGFNPMDYWHMALSFAGIQGYPVKALVLSYAPNGKEIAS